MRENTIFKVNYTFIGLMDCGQEVLPPLNENNDFQFKQSKTILW